MSTIGKDFLVIQLFALASLLQVIFALPVSATSILRNLGKEGLLLVPGKWKPMLRLQMCKGVHMPAALPFASTYLLTRNRDAETFLNAVARIARNFPNVSLTLPSAKQRLNKVYMSCILNSLTGAIRGTIPYGTVFFLL